MVDAHTDVSRALNPSQHGSNLFNRFFHNAFSQLRTTTHHKQPMNNAASLSTSLDAFHRVSKKASDADFLKWIVHLLKNELGVLIACFDFDQTLVDIHTGGRWQGPVEELSQHVRPAFRSLIPELIKNGIQVCVVTYSSQEELIRETLRLSMSELGPAFIVQGNTTGFVRKHGYDAIVKSGKEFHIEACIERLIRERKLPPGMKRSSILLLDDDEHNVRSASSQGHLAFGVDSGLSLAQLYAFLHGAHEQRTSA